MSESASSHEPEAAQAASLRPAFIAVAATGALGAFGALPFYGATIAGSVAAGALLGLANLWALSRLVPLLLGQRRAAGAWTVLFLLKLFALSGALYAVLRVFEADGLALAFGLGALPLGLTLAQLWTGSAPSTPSPAAPPPARPTPSPGLDAALSQQVTRNA